ncbi:MAG TPA: hypothetical protein VH914_01490 [Acidimicrobiia bacterium]|jgi:hypothetical protein|nr:hypothetical protein [Acidimicrobiia bacterium]
MTNEPNDPDEPLDGALARARDAIGTSPPPLDEATRRRLVNRALAERAPAPTPAPAIRRLNRVPPPLLAAAAVIAVVGLGVWALAAMSHSTSETGSASRNGAGAATTTPKAAALGDVSEPRRLLAQVRAALRAQPTDAPITNPSIPGRQCVTTVKTPAGVTARPLSTATYRGAPAIVVVARDDRKTLIYVLDRRDCRLLTSQFFQG